MQIPKTGLNCTDKAMIALVGFAFLGALGAVTTDERDRCLFFGYAIFAGVSLASALSFLFFKVFCSEVPRATIQPEAAEEETTPLLTRATPSIQGF